VHTIEQWHCSLPGHSTTQIEPVGSNRRLNRNLLPGIQVGLHATKKPYKDTDVTAVEGRLEHDADGDEQTVAQSVHKVSTPPWPATSRQRWGNGVSTKL
jgi:hypothetical protein